MGFTPQRRTELTALGQGRRRNPLIPICVQALSES